jgi:hypothetical protein
MCSGSKVAYSWAYAEGSPQFASELSSSSKNLVVGTSVGVIGAIPGTTYTFVLTAQLVVSNTCPIMLRSGSSGMLTESVENMVLFFVRA